MTTLHLMVGLPCGLAELHIDLDKLHGWSDFLQPPTPDELERREA